MVSKLFPLLMDFFWALLSSFFLVLSFPDFNLGILAWIGILPLLIAIHGKGLAFGFLLSLLCGTLFSSGIFHWILEVPNYTLLHHTLIMAYLGLYFAFFGLAFNFISKHWGVNPALFAAPFIWVSLEYIRSNLSFLALPLELLAHSQYQYPIIIQIVSLAGTYSISFLIVMVNVALAKILLPFVFAPRPSPIKEGGKVNGSSLKKREITPYLPLVKGGKEGLRENILIVISASCLIFTLIYGYLTTSQPITGNRFKISLVQGNIDQSKKWDPKYAREIIQIYADLTEQASRTQPTLIIWPETATPGAITLNPRLYTELTRIVRNAGTPLLFGSSQHRKFEEKGSKQLQYTNSAYLFPSEPSLGRTQRYDKIRLFPFSEYVPYKGIAPWSILGVRDSDEYQAGKQYTIFELPSCRFGVIICWENVFPDLVREFVRNGAQFIVNITNEARFGKTAGPYQLASIGVFRAVENRVYVIRCANTGVSCIIDPYGRILDRIKDQKGQDLFVRGVMTGLVIPLNSRTFYTRYGDWMVWVAMLGSVVFLVIALWHKCLLKM